MDEVRQQMILPTIRSYLKLYTSMPMDKLAKYMCTDAENCTVDELESNLLCFKHKMMNLVWTKGTSGLEGEFQAESEVRKSGRVLLVGCELKFQFFYIVFKM